MTYKEHLQKQGYSSTTITHYLKRVADFTTWLAKKRLKAAHIDYKDSLSYVKLLQQKGMQIPTINNHIVSLRNYFDYLMELGDRNDNPLEEVSVKGTVKKVLHNLLESDELEDLYYSFETDSFNKHSNYKARLAAKRNKVIVGLMVYQGLNTTNLKSLLLEHLELYKGKIYVPSTRRNNSRTMELKSWQVLDLLQYVNEIRPQITKYTHIDNDKLFIPQDYFSDLLRRNIIEGQLKKINHKVTTVNHLRASVIVNWLGQYNIRKVQYLAGHKYISTTEKYRQNNLENLQQAVNAFHPLQ